VFIAKNYDQMVDSPFELGTFHEADFSIPGATYRIVVDADPADYDISTLVEQDRKIVRAETEWMQDMPFRSYVFIYHFPRGPAGGGMEHACSTAISASADRIKNNPQASADVSAHEFFHLWNVKRIRPQSLEPVDYTKEQYSTALWFSEGVTSTVEELMLVRAGLKTEDQFLKGVADEIGTLQSRPARRTQSAEESSLETWFDKYPIYHLPERSISYYNKGFILGVLLDLAIRDATHGQKSLRDLFLYLNQNYAKQGRFFADSAGVREAAEAVSGNSFQQFFARYVAGKDEIPYDEYFRSVGLKLDIHDHETADPGFTAARGFEPLRSVISLTPQSEAAKAGMQVGDVIEAINGKPLSGNLEALFAAMKPGDTVKLKIRRGGSPHDLQFRLGSRTQDDYTLVDLPQVTPEQRERRRQWIHSESARTVPQ
jgi:predicted metalloprotease with PDZ domain